jgi:hypothetical protein
MMESARRRLWKDNISGGFATRWELRRLDLPVEASVKTDWLSAAISAGLDRLAPDSAVGFQLTAGLLLRIGKIQWV